MESGRCSCCSTSTGPQVAPRTTVSRGGGPITRGACVPRSDTWVKQGTHDRLKNDVTTARALAGKDLTARAIAAISRRMLKIVLVHENDPNKGGCDFGNMFGATVRAPLAHIRPDSRQVCLALAADLALTLGLALASRKT